MFQRLRALSRRQKALLAIGAGAAGAVSYYLGSRYLETYVDSLRDADRIAAVQVRGRGIWLVKSDSSAQDRGLQSPLGCAHSSHCADADDITQALQTEHQKKEDDEEAETKCASGSV